MQPRVTIITGRLRTSPKQLYKSFVKLQEKLNCLTKTVEYKFSKVVALLRKRKPLHNDENVKVLAKIKAILHIKLQISKSCQFLL